MADGRRRGRACSWAAAKPGDVAQWVKRRPADSRGKPRYDGISGRRRREGGLAVADCELKPHTGGAVAEARSTKPARTDTRPGDRLREIAKWARDTSECAPTRFLSSQRPPTTRRGTQTQAVLC